VNEGSVRQAVRATYGVDQPSLNRIFHRLDDVLQDYNLRLQTMKPEEVFAD
jgi:hypothetical protein